MAATLKADWVCRMISGLADVPGGRVVCVTDAETGRAVRLPKSEIDFGPGRVFVPGWVWRKIYRPTIEKIAAGTPLPQKKAEG